MSRKGKQMSDATSGIVSKECGRWLRKAGAKLGTWTNILRAVGAIVPAAIETADKLGEIGKQVYEMADRLDPVAPVS